MVVLTAEEKRTAEAAYTAAGLGAQGNLGVPLGAPLTTTQTNVTPEFGNGLFPFIKKYTSLPNTKEKKQIGENACEFIYKFIDQPYKQIIIKAGAQLDNSPNLPTEIVTQSIQALQSELTTIEKSYEDRYNDQQTAVTRDKILRSGNGAVTNHQVYLLGRPLRPASIPYLWALSTLFIGFAMLIFYTYSPMDIPDFEVILFDIYLLFSDPFTWAILFSIASVVILFLSLRIAKIL